MYSIIFRLLDREQVSNEETTVDDEEEDGFLKAFKVWYSVFPCYDCAT